MTNDNRGAAALRRFLESTTQGELSAKTGISQSFISRLASAEKTPTLLEHATALQQHARVKIAWWQEPSPCARKVADQ
jgi:predicted transcriptional regulator